MVHFKVTLFLSLMLIHANATIMQCNALFHVLRVKYVLFVSVFIFIYISMNISWFVTPLQKCSELYLCQQHNLPRVVLILDFKIYRLVCYLYKDIHREVLFCGYTEKSYLNRTMWVRFFFLPHAPSCHSTHISPDCLIHHLMFGQLKYFWFMTLIDTLKGNPMNDAHRRMQSLMLPTIENSTVIWGIESTSKNDPVKSTQLFTKT